jgi:hypothetical protein
MKPAPQNIKSLFRLNVLLLDIVDEGVSPLVVSYFMVPWPVVAA